MFNFFKKYLRREDEPAQWPSTPAVPSAFKQSLLSLEQRLMFDAAAAATAAEVKSEQVAQDQAEAAVSPEGAADRTTPEQQESQELLRAIASYSPGESTTEVVFVDPTVPDYQSLVAGMGPNVEVVVLDASRDGVEQIAESLSGRTGVDAIHLITHGDEGRLNLGSGVLTRESMTGAYAEELATIKQSLSDTADILVYGCNFAEGQAGQEAATLLSELTGADVAASIDATGYAGFGGDWVLESQTGAIDTQIAVTEDLQANWKGLLAETWMNAGTGAVIAGPAGNDWYVGDGANNTPVAAGGGADVMYGADGDDTLQGGSGNDILVGGAGNDTLSGNSDDDVILGGAGNDYLDGGSAVGKNTIIGGGGNDQMVGGSGGDVFRFTGAQSGDAYTVDGGGATDIIDLSEFSTATITNSGGVITVDRGGGNVFTITHSNVESIITAATVGNHGPLADAGPDQNVSTSASVTLTAAGSSDPDGNALTYNWTQIEGPKVTLSSATAASPTFTAPGSATTLQFVVVVSDGTTSHADTVTITVGASNSAPTISNLGGDSLSYSEGAGAVVIDQGANALVVDSDSTNFDTGTLTVSIPSGIEPTEDVLGIRNQGTGAGQIGVSGSNVTYGGVTIGTYTGGAGGNNLVITLNGSATQSAVSALVKNITYEDINTDAPSEGALTIRFVLTDGDGGTSANYDVAASVAGVNDAPVLTPYAPMFMTSEGAANVSGRVSDLLSSSLTDVDAGAVEGIAIYGISGSGGTIEYSLDGTTWLSAGSVSSTTALLLRSTDYLRMVPDANNGGTLQVDYRGWDQTSGTAGAKVDASVTGGTTAFSSAADQAIATITSVNDAPTDLALSASSVAENAANGTVIGTISGTDVDTGDTKTYSLTDSAGGRFAIDSSTGVVTVANGTLLNYEAATSHNVTVRVTDSGGLTYDETFTINLTNVNEAPTGANATVTTLEDTPRALATADFGFSDVDAGDTLSAVRIDTLPGAGSLTLSGRAVAAGDVVTAAEIAGGHLVFTPAADANGTGYASLSFSVRDAGNTYDATPNTLTITVTPVNDAPTMLTNNSVTVDEGGQVTFSAKHLEVTDVDNTADQLQYVMTVLPTNGRLLLNGVALSVKDTFTQAELDKGLLEYVHDGSETTSDSFDFTIEDGAGGSMSDTTVKITVTPVNDAPTDLSLSSQTVPENAVNGTVVGTVSATDPDVGDSRSYSLTDTAGGRFAINSSTGVVTVANGALLNYEAATSHNVTVRVTDSSRLSYDETFTITVTNVNEAPSGADATVTLNEDTSHALTAGNFGFSDVDAGDALSAVRIDTLPGAGTLTLSGASVAAGQVITVADITAGNLLFTPAADANGTGYASLTFSVRDAQNTYDSAPNTLIFDVTAVEDAPVNVVPGPQTVNEDAPLAISGLSVSDVDGNLSTVQLAVTNGTLNVTLSGAASISAGSNGSTTLTLSGSQTDINATLASLTYQGAADFAGADTLTMTSTDSNAVTDVDTVSITVTAVNDAPIRTAGTVANLTISEDAGLASLGLGGVNYSPAGGVDESGQTLTYAVTAIPSSSLGDVFLADGTTRVTIGSYSLADIQGMQFKPAANATGVTAFQFNVYDSGGTANGGADSVSQFMLITVTAVNDAPTITNLSGDALSYREGDGAVVIEQGANALVADVDSTNLDTGRLTVSIAAGGDSAEDVLGIQHQGTGPGQIGVSGSAITYGGVTIGTFTGGSSGSDLVITLNSSATPTRVTALVKHITYENTDTDAPTAGARTVRYVLTDGDGGTSANYDTTVTVTAVNDAPVNTVPGPQTVNEDTPLAISGLSANDVDGNLSTVQLDVTHGTLTVTLSGAASINAGTNGSTTLTLSGSQVDINATLASLTYQGAADFAGADTLTMTSTDSNAVTDVDTVSITVTAVNDTPMDLSLSANTVAENASNGTVVGTVTGSDVDTGDTQTYALTDSAGGRFAINSSTGVVTVANGTLLNYEAATSHNVTVRVTDSGGLTYDETFTIQLTNVNEAPTGADATVTLNEDTSHILTVADFGFSDVDAGDALSAVRIDTLPGAGTLTLSGAAVTAGQVITAADLTAGNLVFTPVTDANGAGYASLTFSVRDPQNAYDSVPNTLTFDVTAVNDVPVITVNSGSSVAEGGADTLTSAELAVVDSDNSAPQLSFSVGTGPAHGRLELTTAPGVSATTFTQADIAANRVIYVHDGSETLSDSFTFTLSDGAGGSIGTTTVTLAIAAVNDAPTILSDGGGATASINVAENVTGITVVTGADVDIPVQTLTYGISGGADQALFTIDAATGALSFLASRDFEAASDANGDNVYVVQVGVSDGQGGTVTQTIEVTVTDVAERLPSTSSGPLLPPSLIPATPPPVIAATSPMHEPPGVSAPQEGVSGVPAPIKGIHRESRSVADHTEGRPAGTAPPREENSHKDERPNAPLVLRADEGETHERFTVMPVEFMASDRGVGVEPTISVSDVLMTKLDELAVLLQETIGEEQEKQTLVAHVTALTGTTLSVGFVAWAIRSGALLASCFATIPAWRTFDPLPVVSSSRRERNRRSQETEATRREEEAQFEGLHDVLGTSPVTQPPPHASQRGAA
ncbi:MAG TPA: cadherin-like domain-containing protein [Nitrospira sp.]|nr:cadherin-like domain-containing protein [Nitrospira sp.]